MAERAQGSVSLKLERFVSLWQGGSEAAPRGYPGWTDSSVALIGDISGIQSFVFRPVHGAGGAARRLRARSFRVSAYTELAARWALSRLGGAHPALLYSGGGRFLINCDDHTGWQGAIADLQEKIDRWAWRTFEGELVIHLAAVPARSGRIPWDGLNDALQTRRLQPLSKAFISLKGWANREFIRRSQTGDDRCAGCGVTHLIRLAEDGEKICDRCEQDEKIGRKLLHSRFARLSRQDMFDLEFIDLGLQLCEETDGEAEIWLNMEGESQGSQFWPLLRHVPAINSGAMDFDAIASRSNGARWLGYLRLDVDRAGKAFNDLGGQPLRTWALSHLLHSFFTVGATQLLRSSPFSNIYAVFGGGDDLFVVGPWNEVLEFALALRRRFHEVTKGALTFSAGIALAKPRDHILTKARESGEELEVAKEQPAYGRHCGRDQIRALGVTCTWDDFARLLNQARQVTAWLESREIPTRFLHQALELHHRWAETRRRFPNKETADSVRHHPLLYYQILRNIKPGSASQWAHSLLHPPCDWPWADFIFRYSILASKSSQEEV